MLGIVSGVKTGKDQAAVELGRRGGQARTAEQKAARRRNILKALAVRHPQSVKIRRQLEELEREENWWKAGG